MLLEVGTLVHAKNINIIKDPTILENPFDELYPSLVELPQLLPTSASL